ncbi:hypothetical protein CC86DRAFT_400699 [Ophiobolus disseminans]|uniref:Uncharacterized protein n=1 Tax=Ophiobolus disseminans TaxID=1469910 RepID=A0A6A7AH47_9PLEO|nr:hypothetical protein CC86DRAFT_400699 [Ophiobolus disseminans]
MSLLDLSGELDNAIYEYVAISGAYPLSTGLALASTCRQIRMEYRQLYFRKAKICIKSYQVQSFIELFYPITSADDKITCSIHADICGDDSQEDDPPIDMKWLLTLLLRQPGFQLSFDGDALCGSQAADLDKLVSIVRTNPEWRTHLESFSSITLTISKKWKTNRFSVSGFFCNGIVSHLTMMLKPEVTEDWKKQGLMQVGLNGGLGFERQIHRLSLALELWNPNFSQSESAGVGFHVLWADETSN